MKRDYDIGDYIKITELNSSSQRKRKRPYKGEISFIDTEGNLYGTWGEFIVDPKNDKFERLPQSDRT